MDPYRLTSSEVAAWDGMLKVHARVMRRLDRAFRDRGFSLAEFDIIATLQEAPDGAGLRMSELAERVVLSPSRITRRVEALEHRGFVARRPAPDDGRAVVAYVTDAGNDFVREIARVHHEIVRALYLGGLSREEERVLGTIWERLLALPDGGDT